MVFCFRITGSLIKPTRETLLDYLSYCLIIIALIGVARVFFGADDMTKGCNLNENITATNGHYVSTLGPLNTTASPIISTNADWTSNTSSALQHKRKDPRSISSEDEVESDFESDDADSHDEEIESDSYSNESKLNSMEQKSSKNMSDLIINEPERNESQIMSESDDITNISVTSTTAIEATTGSNSLIGLETTTKEQKAIRNVTVISLIPTTDDVLVYVDTGDVVYHRVSIDICPKYYQAYFPFILLVEGILMLLSGILWVKLPRVNLMVGKFYELVEECRKLDWNKKYLYQSARSPDISSTSVFDPFVHEQEYLINAEYINVLLCKLFNPENTYTSKAHARHLYEQVQIMCSNNNDKTDLWNVYLVKTTVQLVIWITCFTINIGLFVVFQFYIVCDDDGEECNHDTYLRIIWYMGELVVMAYAIFNCRTLMWIHKVSVIHRQHHKSTMISLCATCFGCNYTTDDDVPSELMSCKPFRVDSEQVLTNDMALLLHLLNESWPRLLPYFVIFTYDEWKTKLKTFSTRAIKGHDDSKCDVETSSKPTTDTTDVKSPIKSESQKSIRFFFHSDEEETTSPPKTSSSNEVQYNSEKTVKVYPRPMRKNINSFMHQPTEFHKPKLTKFHSIAVPHGLSMREIAEADRVFVGGCVRPVPSSIKLQAMKMQKPLLRQQESEFRDEEFDAEETDSLLRRFR